MQYILLFFPYSSYPPTINLLSADSFINENFDNLNGSFKFKTVQLFVTKLNFSILEKN